MKNYYIINKKINKQIRMVIGNKCQKNSCKLKSKEVIDITCKQIICTENA